MDKFVKVTQDSFNGVSQLKLNGFQKTAILLGELGPMYSMQILDSLKLSKGYTNRIKKEMARLGYYNPNNEFEVARENAVLEETVNFGIKNNLLIYRKSAPVQRNPLQQNNPALNFNPEDIARVLGEWLKQ